MARSRKQPKKEVGLLNRLKIITRLPGVRFLFSVFVLALLWYSMLLLSLMRPRAIALNTETVNTATPTPIANNTFVYPSLGITSPLLTNSNTDPLAYKDWDVIRKALRKGISLSFREQSLDETPLAFIIGHSSDTYPHAYSSIFAGLGQAKTDDTFSFAINNKTYNYRVIEQKILNPRDIAGFSKLAPTDLTKPRVVLVTCWPVLTTRERLVVIGERI